MKAKPKTLDDLPEADRDRHMILHPDLWPCWPYLPVKRRDAQGRCWGSIEDRCMGVVLADEGLVKQGIPTVYHVYLFRLPPTPAEFVSSPQTAYPSVDAMLADGWVVD